MKTDSYACFETTGGISEAGEYKIIAVMSDRDTGEQLDEKDYRFNIYKNDVKNTLEKRAEADSTIKPRWGSGYYVLERKYMYFAGGISAAVILTLFGLLLFKKSK